MPRPCLSPSVEERTCPGCVEKAEERVHVKCFIRSHHRVSSVSSAGATPGGEDSAGIPAETHSGADVEVSTGIGRLGCDSRGRCGGTIETDNGDWPARGTSSPALGGCPGNILIWLADSCGWPTDSATLGHLSPGRT